MSGDAETLASYNRSSELRSIANSIEPAFPSAADYLRGIAREIAAHDAAIRAEGVEGALAGAMKRILDACDQDEDGWGITQGMTAAASLVALCIVENAEAIQALRAAQPTEGES